MDTRPKHVLNDLNVKHADKRTTLRYHAELMKLSHLEQTEIGPVGDAEPKDISRWIVNTLMPDLDQDLPVDSEDTIGVNLEAEIEEKEALNAEEEEEDIKSKIVKKNT